MSALWRFFLTPGEFLLPAISGSFCGLDSDPPIYGNYHMLLARSLRWLLVLHESPLGLTVIATTRGNTVGVTKAPLTRSSKNPFRTVAEAIMIPIPLVGLVARGIDPMYGDGPKPTRCLTTGARPSTAVLVMHKYNPEGPCTQ